jgi:DNA-directed RNA polymerase specialized sigma subunit
MPQFNPDFWEIPVPPTYFHQFCNEDLSWYDPPALREHHRDLQAKKQKLLTHVREIIEHELTPMQKRCVRLYFFEGKTQEEIALVLGISRRVVSQHIFGITRNGKKIGGAINKIRKVCGKRGVSW